MATSLIEDERVRWRRDGEKSSGGHVVYWMQQAQRTQHNPALELAVRQANELALPLVVVFCLIGDYPEASARHYRFMLQGLVDVEQHLARRGIRFDVIVGEAATTLGRLDARTALLVTDRGYLPIQRAWRDDVEAATGGPLVEVETDVVVPIDLVTDKMETAARTIRPKITRHVDRFVVELTTTALDNHSVGSEAVDSDWSRALSDSDLDCVDLDDLDAVIDRLGVAAEPGPVSSWRGGENEAHRLLGAFIDGVLGDYESLRNRYDVDHSSSRLSPYLHYGQISPVDVVRRIRAAAAPSDHVAAFVEELVVRRELAINLVVHHSDFDRFAGLPAWAKETLRARSEDEREVVLTAAELEAGETPDEIWNAIMAQIRDEGWTHNQLRMYWGKQILRWTNTPEHAFRTLLDLNNRHFLDGRDPNSYANVAWCFGRHDQGFQERDVIGKIRPFTDKALKRKGDLEGWLESRRESNRETT
ncbi:MAG: deoxyribodipyrimidine photo-lyase [Acidimicrobiia bacterium]|nr:deoxyribodipyrimidine photo-lyase [Acidimicrobiia bacterium]